MQYEDDESLLLNTLLSDLHLSHEDAAQLYETNLRNGLDHDEAQQRLENNGPNVEVARKSKLVEVVKLFKNLFGVHNLQLWLGSAVCFVVYLTDNYLTEHDLEIKPDNLYIGIILVTFVMALGMFSYYMNAKCDYYLETCRDFISHYCTVIRDAIPQQIDQQKLVTGDLVFFRTGEQLAADLKLIECSAVRINHSMLSQFQRYYYTRLYGKNCCSNSERFYQSGEILFCGTFICSGHGKGIVTRTGKYYLSKCKHNNKRKSTNDRLDDAKLAQEIGPLSDELNHFLNRITFLAIVIGIVFGLWSLWNGFSLLRAVMLAVALYVAIVTQSLLPTLNVAKTQIAKELASKNCYIQNIDALETLGNTSVICTNKTGVITQNKMIIAKVWINNQLMASYEFMRDFKGCNKQLKEPYSSFVRVLSLATFGLFTLDNEPNISPFKRNTLGKPSEVAILRFMEAFNGCSIEQLQNRQRKRLEMIFNHKTRCSFKMFNYENQNKNEENLLQVCLKGEPETLIAKCETILTSDGSKEFSYFEKNRLIALCDELGKKKYRTIAIAQSFLPESFLLNDPTDIVRFNDALHNNQLDIQFLGIIVLENPVRMSVPEAIFKCRQAGIKVIMTTADHPQTALSIAKTVGIVLFPSKTANDSLINMIESSDLPEKALQSNPLNLYTGKQLEKISDTRLEMILSTVRDLVFGRISPEDKLRIVNCCRKLKWIVAVTGIGSSDLPVYERAHVRVSLSKYGADISKHNSDVILLDDNFASIVHGIEEGRVLFDNIKKSLCYTMSSKPVQIYPYLLTFMFDMPKMASSITVLAIDLITDYLPPIAIGYEGAESNVMLRSSRHVSGETIVNFQTIFTSLFFYGTIQFLSGIFSYFVAMAENGFLPSELFFISGPWYSAAINDLEDSYGQEWTYQQRSELEFNCHTIYFTTIVLSRIAVLQSCRTRQDSILRKLFSNTMINFSVFFLLFFSAFLSYYPIFQILVQMYPIKISWWLIAIPFFVLTLVLDETRKFIIRKYPNSAVAQILVY